MLLTGGGGAGRGELLCQVGDIQGGHRSCGRGEGALRQLRGHSPGWYPSNSGWKFRLGSKGTLILSATASHSLGTG